MNSPSSNLSGIKCGYSVPPLSQSRPKRRAARFYIANATAAASTTTPAAAAATATKPTTTTATS